MSRLVVIQDITASGNVGALGTCRQYYTADVSINHRSSSIGIYQGEVHAVDGIEIGKF